MGSASPHRHQMKQISFIERNIHTLAVGQVFRKIDDHPQFHINLALLIKNGLVDAGAVFLAQRVDKVAKRITGEFKFQVLFL